MPRAFRVCILIFRSRDEIERFLVLGEGGDGVEVISLVGYVVGQKQTKRFVGSEAEFQGLLLVLPRVGRVGDQDVMLGDLLRGHISIEIPHLVRDLREAQPTQQANDGALAIVRVINGKSRLALLLPQGPTEPDEEGFQILISAEGTFEMVGVVGGEGVVVEGGAGDGGEGSGSRVLLSWRIGLGCGGRDRS